MRWTPWIVVIYMLAALCWWTYLLYSKNEVIYQQQIALLSLQENVSEQEIANLSDERQRQKYMIISEGIVFGVALITGIAFLYGAYRKTLLFSQRQNNFLLSVTHELKSPLASIKLAFETIKKRNLKPEQNALISDNGISEVNRLHSQVENILNATSIDQKYTVHLENSNLENVLQDIKALRSSRPYEHRVNYSILNKNDRNFDVDVYGCQLIADNLIGNALKYSEGPVQLDLDIRKNKLILLVSDQGPGIDEKEKKNIFNRFYRIGNEDTRKSKGTGLGLFIVKRIVEKNNGTIKVENNKPKGSIFNVEMEIK